MPANNYHLFNIVSVIANYLLEIRACGCNLVHKILDAENIEFAKSFFDYSVVCQRNTLLLNFAVSAFVDKFADGLQVRLAIVRMSLTYLKKDETRNVHTRM